MKRNRILYLVLLIVVIVIGLSTRKLPHLFPDFIAEYGGDTLWSLMFFIIFGIIFQRKPSLWVAGLTLAFAFLIEFSQLYQADWIKDLRATFIGSMLLGHGFLLSDFICYSIGAIVGFLAEIFFYPKVKV